MTTKLSALFDPEPARWGLRGDPYLWRALRERLAGTDLPASLSEVTTILHTAFTQLAGANLTGETLSSVHREQYAHGGMSSGMISLEAWREDLMPVLLERASQLLRGLPAATGNAQSPAAER